MYYHAESARDPFTFSLRGMAAINPYGIVPAVDSDGINRAWRARLTYTGQAAIGKEERQFTRRVESLLARYFAPGCCDAARVRQ